MTKWNSTFIPRCLDMTEDHALLAAHVFLSILSSERTKVRSCMGTYTSISFFITALKETFPLVSFIAFRRPCGARKEIKHVLPWISSLTYHSQ